MPNTYRGRFAPSPTGPLHFGSLVAAVASCLEARANRGRWLVRIEDLDPPRVVPHAGERILRALHAYGMRSDEPVLWQSTRAPAYAAALERLRARGLVYPCACSRREIAESALAGVEGFVYPGTCRDGLPRGRSPRAWRVRTEGVCIAFEDAIQGSLRYDLELETGDFVLCRADGAYAYQLAVVVDDAAQGITDIVRGADLIDSTPRQIHLQRLLSLPTPRYAHVPVAVNERGEKLSKQTLARALRERDAVPELSRALRFLGQSPPEGLAASQLEELWSWARANWRGERIPRVRTQPAG
jgi:glutamyl-Q tRNA(Asp) synthetase